MGGAGDGVTPWTCSTCCAAGGQGLVRLDGRRAYRLLETIPFTRSKLAGAAALAAAATATSCLDLVCRDQPRTPTVAMAAAEADYANLVAALDWSLGGEPAENCWPAQPGIDVALAPPRPPVGRPGAGAPGGSGAWVRAITSPAWAWPADRWPVPARCQAGMPQAPGMPGPRAATVQLERYAGGRSRQLD
jgi:hypothetical protein